MSTISKDAAGPNLHKIERKNANRITSRSNAKGSAATDCYSRDKIDSNVELLKGYDGEPITQGNQKTIQLIRSEHAYNPSRERVGDYFNKLHDKRS
jgi:hypothetical protein